MIEPANDTAPITAESTRGERDVVRRRDAGVVDFQQLAGRDERGGAAARAVEDRDHLRHRGHLHALRGDDSDRRADDERRADHPPVHDPLAERRDDREQHPDRADAVAEPRRLRRAQVAQPEDEQDRR